VDEPQIRDEVRRILQRDPRVGILLAEILAPPLAAEDAPVKPWER